MICEPVGEAEVRDAVRDAVVDHLGLERRAGVTLGIGVEHLGGGRRVDVLVRGEALQEHVLAVMCASTRSSIWL